MASDEPAVPSIPVSAGPFDDVSSGRSVLPSDYLEMASDEPAVPSIPVSAGPFDDVSSGRSVLPSDYLVFAKNDSAATEDSPVESIYQSALQDCFDHLLVLTKTLPELAAALMAAMYPAEYPNIDVLGASADEILAQINGYEEMILLLKDKLKGCSDVILVRDVDGLDLVTTLYDEGIYMAPKVCCLSFESESEMARIVSNYRFNIHVVFNSEAFVRELSVSASTSGRT